VKILLEGAVESGSALAAMRLASDHLQGLRLEAALAVLEQANEKKLFAASTGSPNKLLSQNLEAVLQETRRAMQPSVSGGKP
jgi:hypothetical protein